MPEVAPQIAFYLFGIPVRESVVSTWVMMLIIIIIAVIINRWRPTALELLVDFLNDTISQVMGYPAKDFLPLLGALAIFIATANVIGSVPYLSAPTGDINTPVALALIVFFSVHFFGIRDEGFVSYFKGMATPIYLLPLEIISHITRTMSLAIRLFGNIFSAELIVAIIFALVPLFVPLPLIGLGIFTGMLQAYIFTALAAVYIAAGIRAARAES